MPQEIFITTAQNVKEGEGFAFKYKGRNAILIVRPDGYKAFINICPHSGYETKMMEGKLRCMGHFALFDPDTGKGLTPPALNSSLLEIKLKVADNKIYHLNTIVFKPKNK